MDKEVNTIAPKKTLIVNYRELRIGGIETYLAKLMLYSANQGYRVIWLTTEKAYKRCHFKDIVDHPRVERVILKGKSSVNWLKHDKISFQDEEHVTMFSVTPMTFMQAEQIREYTKNVASFNHFMALPHFTGSDYFPERTFKTKLYRKRWYNYMKKIATILVENDCVRAFSMKHLDFFEENYGVKIENKQEKILKKINLIKDYPDSYFEEKAQKRQDEFRIVTCGRFDFPHKGYILGLLDEYAELKKKYTQLKLVVIGYGKDGARVDEKIAQMSPEAQKDIEIVGAVSPFDLYDYFEEGHLNIGLAGALFDGAICAIPSLCARHYCEDCEVYGFISDMEGTYLRDEPALRLQPFIEKLIEISDDEYINQAKRDFQRAKELKTNYPEYLFEQQNKSSQSVIKGCLKLRAKKLSLLKVLTSKMYKLPGYESEKK